MGTVRHIFEINFKLRYGTRLFEVCEDRTSICSNWPIADPQREWAAENRILFTEFEAYGSFFLSFPSVAECLTYFMRWR